MSWAKLEKSLDALSAEHMMILLDKDGWGKDNGESVVARNIACYYPDPQKVFPESWKSTRDDFFSALEKLKKPFRLRRPEMDQAEDSPTLFLGCSLARGSDNTYEVACAVNAEAARETLDEWRKD